MTQATFECAFCPIRLPNAQQRGQHQRRHHPGLKVERPRLRAKPRCANVLYGWGRCADDRGHAGLHSYEEMEP